MLPMVVICSFPPCSCRVPVLALPWMRRSTWTGLSWLRAAPVMWTLLAPLSAAAAACSTWAADRFSRPLGWVALGWVALGWVALGWVALGWVLPVLLPPPQPLLTSATSTTVA